MQNKLLILTAVKLFFTVVIPEINAEDLNGPITSQNQGPLIFRIPDGTKEGSYIGNLPQNANLDSPSNSYLRKFVIVAGDNLIKVRIFASNYFRKALSKLKLIYSSTSFNP